MLLINNFGKLLKLYFKYNFYLNFNSKDLLVIFTFIIIN